MSKPYANICNILSEWEKTVVFGCDGNREKKIIMPVSKKPRISHILKNFSPLTCPEFFKIFKPF